MLQKYLKLNSQSEVCETKCERRRRREEELEHKKQVELTIRS